MIFRQIESKISVCLFAFCSSNNIDLSFISFCTIINYKKFHKEIFVMNKKKKVFENDFNVTEEQMDSLARVLFPLVYDYLTSEKGADNDVDTLDPVHKCA